VKLRKIASAAANARPKYSKKSAKTTMESSAAADPSSTAETASPPYTRRADSLLLWALFAAAIVGLVAGSTVLTHPLVLETAWRLPTLGDLSLFREYGLVVLGQSFLAFVLFALAGGFTEGRRLLRPSTATFIAAVVAVIPLAICYRNLVMRGATDYHLATARETSFFPAGHTELLAEAPDALYMAEEQLIDSAPASQQAVLKDPHLLLPHSRFHVFLLLSVFPAIYSLAFAIAATLSPSWSPFGSVSG
jgi:hypothetical protein